jgi:uncharacterized protein YecA (UPF0149 family)
MDRPPVSRARRGVPRIWTPQKVIVKKVLKMVASVREALRGLGNDERDAPHQCDTRGAVAKIGRNEPCPCGSGKKHVDEGQSDDR